MSIQSLKDKALELMRAARESLAPEQQQQPKRLPQPRLPVRLVSRQRYRVQRDTSPA
jgi:hypothetical protein